jgi:hypothetical protein
MIVGETFTVNIHNLSIDECINLLITLKQNKELINRIKDLIIIKKLIKVISERHQISGYYPINRMIYRIDTYCRNRYFDIKNNEYRDEKLLRQFKEFQRIYSTGCRIKTEMLFTVFYAERAINDLYYL